MALKAFFISGRDAHGRRRQMRRAKLLQIRTEIRLKKCEKVPGGGGSATVVTMPPLLYNWSNAAGCPLFYVFHAMTLACLTASAEASAPSLLALWFSYSFTAGSLKYNVSQSMCSMGRKRVASCNIIGERQAACTFCVAEGAQ